MVSQSRSTQEQSADWFATSNITAEEEIYD
jgi:hypothetical protein